VTKRLAPGADVSAVGFASVQVLLVWESVALWCGAAVVLGCCAPVFSGFKGSGGIAAAVAIAAVHAPAVLLSGVGAFAVGMAIFRGRSHEALAVALAAPPAYEWVAWAADLQNGWGVTHGPELALWTAAVSSILLARWWARDPQ
jgi:glycerol-3-phosphate acyltransferase PlsY